MGRVFSRQEMTERFRAQIAADAPIVAAGPANGIVAKCAARAGADLIVSSTMHTPRSMGFPTRVIADFGGEESKKMIDIFWQVVNTAPLVVGLDANDILSLDHERLLDRFADSGISGVANLPSVQHFGDPYRTRSTKMRRGFNREIELIERAHARGLFSVGFVFYPDDARDMVRAGADMIIATAGHTQGGSTGYAEQSFDEAIGKIAPTIEAALAENADVICLGHGGPFNSPASTSELYARTKAVGVYATAGLDRIPIEKAIKKKIEDYKSPILADLRASV